MKNIQNKLNFNKLIDDIDNLINEYINSNKIISKKELLKEMKLPYNFLILKW